MVPKFFAVLALAALAVSPATAFPLERPAVLPSSEALPGFEPALAGPVTGYGSGGPAVAFLIPPGAITGAPIPGYGGLISVPGYAQPIWEIHAGGFKWRCNVHFGRGDVFVDGLNSPIAAGRPCTGRFNTQVDYVVSFAQSGYAGVVASMGGLIVAGPMPI